MGDVTRQNGVNQLHEASMAANKEPGTWEKARQHERENQHINLRGAYLNKADLRGANLSGAKLLQPDWEAPMALEGQPALARPGGDAHFTVLLLGDIGFGESYRAVRRLLKTYGHRYSLDRVMDLLNAADLAIGNLEVPLAPTPDPALHGRKNWLGWSDADKTVAALLEADFDALSVANNHALDCGEVGLCDTIRRLQESGIAAFGAGVDLAAAGQPFVRTVRIGPVERTIVVFGCFEFRKRYDERYNWYAGAERSGVNPIAPKTIAEQIADLRKTVPAPFFIIYPHWGVDYRDIKQYQRDYANQLMAAGADLIVGHGTHALQGIEMVAGRPMVYGIGNFVWNTPGRFASMGSLPYGLAAAVRFSHQNDGVSVFLRLYPLLTDNSVTNFQTRPVSAAEFPEAVAALTRNYDVTDNNIVAEMDRLGCYLEVPVNTPAPKGGGFQLHRDARIEKQASSSD
jgi:cyanophycin synthetase